MTYDEAEIFLKKAAGYGSRPGLETISELLRRLDNPQDRLKVIHIAGTNGKGSTGAFIASILAAAGYRAGRFVSPAVFDSREMVQITYSCKKQIATDYITEDGICKAVSVIEKACNEMVRDGFSHPTVFEIETAIAFLYLLHERVDFAIIEAGMGGRLDATNVVTQPLCSIITSISMDHMQYLGNTLEEISRHKAGIIKKGTAAATVNTDPVIVKVLKDECQRMNATLTIASCKDAVIHSLSCEETSFSYKGHDYKIKLLGEHQLANAILALEAVAILQKQGYKISQESIESGLLQTSWRGRFEIIAKNPYFIIDGAHNEDAAGRLYEAVKTYFNGKRLIFIMGIFADKDYKKVLEIMAPFASVIITITPPSSRALPSSKLAKEAAKYFSGTIIDAGTAAAAVDYAYANSAPADVILAFGSLSYLHEISEYLNRKYQDRTN